MFPIETEDKPLSFKAKVFTLGGLYMAWGVLVTAFCIPYLLARALIGSLFKK